MKELKWQLFLVTGTFEGYASHHNLHLISLWQILSWFIDSTCTIFSNIIFCIEQLAEPIRLLLNYTETEFKDERYELGDGKVSEISRDH